MRKTVLKPVQPPHGSQPAEFNEHDVVSVQAVMRGSADADQQQRAMKWILEGACGLPVWPYKESQRETDLALGRQFVGQQIMGLLKVNISQLRSTRNG